MYDNNTFVDGVEYATNAEGEGLFMWHATKREWKQILGTCQFSVKNVKDKKGKIRRAVRG